MNGIKEYFSEGLESTIQQAGISVLLYDPRNTGKSEGWPRNEIDPFRQTPDYYDALTYLSTLPIVDPKQIFFWGVSMSGGIALMAAAIDKRARGVIAVAPTFDRDTIPKPIVEKILSKAMRDREAQMYHGNPPFFVSAMEARGLVPLGSRMSAGAAPTDTSRLSHNEKGSTIQSYTYMKLWQPIPRNILSDIYPTPVMFVTPENDDISSPETQKTLFASLKGPKKFHFALGKAHLDVLMGEQHIATMARAIIEFVWQPEEMHTANDDQKITKSSLDTDNPVQPSYN
jgi:pimeloyl-ACP methyl ester carboxylesterase